MQCFVIDLFIFSGAAITSSNLTYNTNHNISNNYDNIDNNNNNKELWYWYNYHYLQIQIQLSEVDQTEQKWNVNL